ncbi:MAG: P-loop NTPase [Desulfobulbaceae bacterium]|nr:P-loop NTPase [Candidatus Kapabacteria bacterium]MBS3999854.1 P-loop NTPase [Desulfobulbaceae bacterium]
MNNIYTQSFLHSREKTPIAISICSGKGGVGKSFISSNLAYLLSESGAKVLIFDADSQFPNQHLIMGVEPPVRLSQVYKKNVKVSDAIFQVDKNLFLLADMPAGGLNNTTDEYALIDVYKKILLEHDFDFIILDSPAGATQRVIESCEIANMTIFVITDEPTSLLDAYGLIKILLNYIPVSKMRLLVNNVIDFEDADEMSRKLNAATMKFLGLEIEALGFVPYDRMVRLSIQKQELLCQINPNHEVSNALKRIITAINNDSTVIIS